MRRVQAVRDDFIAEWKKYTRILFFYYRLMGLDTFLFFTDTLYRRARLLCSLCSRIARPVNPPKIVSPKRVKNTPRRDIM